MQREFSVVVERDEEGFYVGSVPTLPGCHTQAGSLDELMIRIREAIELLPPLPVSSRGEGWGEGRQRKRSVKGGGKH